MCARLVRGRDTGGNFDLVPEPEGEFHPAALKRHERAYRLFRDNYAEQIVAHEREFAAQRALEEGLPSESPSSRQFNP
jgi:hypothetical protein